MSGYQVDAYGQFLTAVISAAAGASLCLLYDLLRLVRYAHRPSAVWAFFQDVAWWLVATAVTALILLVRCSGAVRLFALLGLAVGFVCCRFTLSLLIMKIGKKIADIVKGVLNVIFGRILAPVCKWIGSLLSKIIKIIKKFLKSVKNLLKDSVPLVYNHLKSWAKSLNVKRSNDGV